MRTTRSSPSTKPTCASKSSASRATCLPDSRCLAISSPSRSWRWHLTTAPPSTGSWSSHSSPSTKPSGSGSPAIQPVRRWRGDTSAFSGSAGKLPKAWRSALTTFSAALREDESTAMKPCCRSSIAFTRLGRTKARGSSSCTTSSLSARRALPPSLRAPFASMAAIRLPTSSWITEPGSSRSSLPMVIHNASPTRCESAGSSRPKGDTKPRELGSSGPTGLSTNSASSASMSSNRARSAGLKRNNVRLRKNIRIRGGVQSDILPCRLGPGLSPGPARR